MSARSARKIQSGRRNNDLESTFVSQTKAERLNDPLQVHRPFSATPKQIPVPIRKQFLQKSRDSTVISKNDPDLLLGTLKRKPSMCPAEFLETANQPTWLSQVDSKAMVDERFKTQMARDFIERNRHRLWQFDYKYSNLTPRSVCDDLCSQTNFMKIMKKFDRRESMLDRGTSSHRISAAMIEDGLEIPKSRQLAEDVFAITLKTSREEKIDRVNRLLAPGRMTMANSYRRGALHDADFGNFGRYSAFMKINAT